MKLLLIFILSVTMSSCLSFKPKRGTCRSDRDCQRLTSSGGRCLPRGLCHFGNCDVGVKSGDIYDQRFPVEFALQRARKEELGKNYWLSPDRKAGGEFILDLGCEESFNTVELVNTHNHYHKDRATKRFQVFLSLSEKGPWQQVLDKTLEDSRNQNDPLPLQEFNFNSVTARYVKFKLLSYWGYGGGLQYFNVKKLDYAVLITGGTTEEIKNAEYALRSSELYNPATKTSCSLPQLSDRRRYHSLDGGILCGGELEFGSHENSDSHILTLCETFTNGKWIQSHTLKLKRRSHVSWATSSGVYLIGGFRSPYSSEIVKEDGTSMEGFRLKYKTYHSCGIPDPDNEEFIITGGESENIRTTVSVYKKSGWNRNLASLKQGRFRHACARYSDGDAQVLIVTGGHIGSAFLDSTEIYRNNAWNTAAAKLPAKMIDMRATTVDNNILILGGVDWSKKDYDTILEYSQDTDEWKQVGSMKEAKRSHAVSVVRFQDYSKYCI